jgi:hypothetical protein
VRDQFGKYDISVFNRQMPVMCGPSTANSASGNFVNLPNTSPLSTGVLYGLLQRLKIPDAVIIQFYLLKMSMVLLETCRGL